jgi:glycerol kinase
MTKLKWILDNVESARARADKGDLAFGTIDTWLAWKLSGGNIHITDYTNASRTMMFNINTLKWDEDILREFNIPSSMLPTVMPSRSIFGYTDSAITGNVSIPIAGIAGDQQAALFGQACVKKGDIKNTYGTGCFLLMNTGNTPFFSDIGLITTLAVSPESDGLPVYAIEGSVFIAGAVIQWIRDELGLIKSSEESENAALSVNDNNGVYIVPAFTGLGAPYWNSHVKGIITGLTRGANKNHLIRAALESIAYQTNDVINTIKTDINPQGMNLTDNANLSFRVDGGASANNFLIQFQSDISNIEIERPSCIESTALGVSYITWLSTGLYNNMEDIIKMRQVDKIFKPDMRESTRNNYLNEWKSAVKKAITD